MAGIIAHRIARIRPMTFSIGMNDYGFELLTDQSLDVETLFSQELFAQEVHEALNTTMNASQMTSVFRILQQLQVLCLQAFQENLERPTYTSDFAALLQCV